MASSFSTLRKRGYGTIYAIKIEGIPYIFTEGPIPYRVDSEAAPSVPTGYTSASSAFAIVSETTIDQEIDREGAITRGKAADIILAWDVLDSDGLLPLLFRRPEYFTTLDEDTTAIVTTVEVDSAASFASSGTFYLGRELIKYTGKTGTSFTGCTRGYLGYAYMFRKDDPGSHGIVTPTPYAWKGRFVTIHEHLISPEGRILDSTWTEGTYQRELWKGYLSDPPVPGKLGMTLRAMPLQRLGALELGSDLEADLIGLGGSGDWKDFPVYVDIGAGVEFQIKPYAGSIGAWESYTVPSVEVGATFPTTVAGTSPSTAAIPPGVYTVGMFGQIVANRLEAALDAAGYTGVATVVLGSVGPTTVGSPGKGWNQQIVTQWNITYSDDETEKRPFLVEIFPTSACYWLKSFEDKFPVSLDWISPSGQGDANSFVEVYIELKASNYLLAKNIEGDSALDYTLGDTGLAYVDAGAHSEIVRWDEKFTTLADGSTSISPFVVLHLAERMIGAEFATVPQEQAELGEDGKIASIAGKIGTLKEVAETFLQSSGTGLRGDEDTLDLGYGLGIPSAWIELDGNGTIQITKQPVPFLSVGRVTFADMFNGWYRLEGTCLALRRNASGVLVLQRVQSAPAQMITTSGAGHYGSAIPKSDVVVGGADVPRLVVAPNKVAIDSTVGPYDSAQYLYNAVGRIQAEGAHSISLAVPGARSEIISAPVLMLMARGIGQSIIKLSVAPWVDIQVGDPIACQVRHPLLYDWSDGTREPVSVPGRCVGHSTNMKTGEQSLTLLLDGLQASGYWLCPTTAVQSIAGNDITVGDGQWFRSGERVRFYNRGMEATELQDLTVTTVAGNILTLASSPPGWVSAGSEKTYCTQPDYTVASEEQQDPYMFVRSDRFWRS